MTCWQMVYISELYVEEYYRHQGLGSALLQKVEDTAKTSSALISYLDTFDWQAKHFYLKHGYEIFGQIDNCPAGHQRLFLKKTL